MCCFHLQGIPSVTYNVLVGFLVHFFRCDCEHQVLASAHVLQLSLVANVHLTFASAHALHLTFASAHALHLTFASAHALHLTFASAHALRLSLVANVYLMFIIYYFETSCNVA